MQPWRSAVQRIVIVAVRAAASGGRTMAAASNDNAAAASRRRKRAGMGIWIVTWQGVAHFPDRRQPEGTPETPEGDRMEFHRRRETADAPKHVFPRGERTGGARFRATMWVGNF